MTTNPNGYRTFPAFNTGYGYAPMATTPSSQKPTYPLPPATTPGLPYRAPVAAPNPYANPYAAQSLHPLANRSFMDRFMPVQATTGYPPVASPPQQPMLISLTAPKMTKEEMHKKFWLIAGGGTVAIVSGILLVSFVGLKILPQRIAGELKGQTHSSMLRALDDQSIGKVLKRIKDRVLTRESKASDELHTKWGKKSVGDIFGVSKEHDGFLKDIGQHLSVTDLGSLIWQQMFRKTFTPEFIKEQSHSFSDALLSDTAKQTLLQKVAHKPEIQKILKAEIPAGKTFADLSKEKQNAVMAQIYQHTYLSDSLGAAATDATRSTLRSTFITEDNLTQALKAKSLQGKLPEGIDKLPKDQQLAHVLEHIGLEDAVNLASNNIRQELIKNSISQVKGELLNQQKLDEALKSPSITAKLNGLNPAPDLSTDEAKINFISKHISFHELSKLFIEDEAVQNAIDGSVKRASKNATDNIFSEITKKLAANQDITKALELPSVKSHLPQNPTQQQKVQTIQEHITFNDAAKLFADDVVQSSSKKALNNATSHLKSLLLQPQSLEKAIQSAPSLHAHEAELRALSHNPGEQLQRAQQYISIQDAAKLLTNDAAQEAVANSINQVRKTLVGNPVNLDRAMEMPSIQTKLTQLGKSAVQYPTTEDKTTFIQDHLSFTDAIKLFTNELGQDTVKNSIAQIKTELLNKQKLAEALNTPSVAAKFQELEPSLNTDEEKIKFIGEHISVQELSKLFIEDDAVQGAVKETVNRNLAESLNKFRRLLVENPTNVDAAMEMQSIKNKLAERGETIENYADEASRIKFVQDYISFDDAAKLFANDALIGQFKGSIISEKNVNAAMESPSIQQAFSAKNAAFQSKQEQLDFIKQHISLQDATNVLTRSTLSDTLRSSLSPQAKQFLFDKVKDAEEVKKVLTKISYNTKGQPPINDLTLQEQQDILEAVHKCIPTSDYIAAIGSDTFGSALGAVTGIRGTLLRKVLGGN